MSRLWLILLLPLSAVAGEVVLTWENATQRTDGTPLPIEEIAESRIYYSLCENGEVTDSPAMQSYPPTQTTATIPVTDGEWCFRATHVDTNGLESELSNLAIRVVLTAPPSPPASLTAQDVIAYNLIKGEGRLVMVPVGFIPADTPCDSTQTVNGKYAVPVSAVEYDPRVTVRPSIVFADCS